MTSSGQNQMTVANPIPVAAMIAVAASSKRPQRRAVGREAEAEREHGRPEQRAGDDRADLDRREAEPGQVLREQHADEPVGEPANGAADDDPAYVGRGRRGEQPVGTKLHGSSVGITSEKIGLGPVRSSTSRAPSASASARAECEPDPMAPIGAAFEDPSRVEHSRPLVADLDHDRARNARPCGDGHVAGAVTIRVGDQHLEDLADRRLGDDGRGKIVLDHEPDPAAARREQTVPVLLGFVEQRGDVERRRDRLRRHGRDAAGLRPWSPAGRSAEASLRAWPGRRAPAPAARSPPSPAIRRSASGADGTRQC